MIGDGRMGDGQWAVAVAMGDGRWVNGRMGDGRMGDGRMGRWANGPNLAHRRIGSLSQRQKFLHGDSVTRLTSGSLLTCCQHQVNCQWEAIG